MRYFALWPVFAVVSILPGCYRTIDVNKAMKREYFQRVELKASDGTSCTAKIIASSSGPKNFTVVIPRATLIYNFDEDSQLLMTAKTVAIRVRGSESESVQIETYCVNQFAREPKSRSTLSFVSMPAEARADEVSHATVVRPEGYTYEVPETEIVEAEPVRKLAECLEKSGESRHSRQMAVWLVANNYLNVSYETVHRSLHENYRKELEREIRAQESDIRSELLREEPDLSGYEADQAIERYMKNKLDDKLEIEAEKKAQSDLAEFIAGGKQVLESCNFDVNNREFFRTASSKNVSTNPQEVAIR